MRQKKNVILADCEEEEIKTLVEGLEETSQEKVEILSYINNKGQGSAVKRLNRYMKLFTFPFSVFIHRKQYDVIYGWQQFYTLIYAFYCRLFNVKKTNKVIVLNFTYKDKSGVVGKLYRRFMEFIICSKYIDRLHVPSKDYAALTAKDFGISLDKFLVTTFGIPDYYQSEYTEVPVNTVGGGYFELR